MPVIRGLGLLWEALDRASAPLFWRTDIAAQDIPKEKGISDAETGKS